MPIIHPLEPVITPNARLLILGSFPSVQSREAGFYYGNPQNRFWKVMAYVLRCPVPQTVDEKRAMLVTGKVALFDVLKSCEITGSADASIRSAAANDIPRLIEHTCIHAVFFNGATAARYYKRLIADKPAVYHAVLPSTSPANAQFRLEQLQEIWAQKLRPWL